MRIFLTGVLEDGTDRAAGVPNNPRTAIKVPRGTDLELVVTVVRPSGTKVNLSLPDTEMSFSLKRRSDEPAKVSKTATLAPTQGTFTIARNDTKSVTPGLYSYDIWLRQGDQMDAVIALSPFLIQEGNVAVPPVAAQSVVYWGADVDGLSTEADIKGLSDNDLAYSRNRTFQADAGAGEHIYYAIPVAFGTPTFTVGGFVGGFIKQAANVPVTNGAVTQDYDLWKTVQANLGITIVTVT